MPQKGFSKPRTRGLTLGWGTSWILVIVVVVAATGVLVWHQLQAPTEEGQAPTEEEQPPAEEAEAPQEEAQPPTDETANLPAKALATEGWKTYRNEEYGFEVRYPLEWRLWTLGSFEARFYHPDYYLKGPFTGDEWFLAVIMVHKQFAHEKNWQRTALSTMTREDQDMIVESSFQEGEAYRLTQCPDRLFKADYEYCGEGIWFPHSRKDVVLYFSVSMAPYEYAKEKKTIVDIFDQMLSTFRFLE